MRNYERYRPRPDIRPVPSHADLDGGKVHFTPHSIKSMDLWSEGVIQYGYYGVSKYGKCLYGGANTVTQDILANLFDAHSMLYAVADATPLALTVAEQRLVGRITGGNIVALTQAQIETLVLTDSARYVSSIMPLQVARVIAAGKPTRVTQGIFQGFSLPTYAADEELFTCICVPYRWDGASDLIVYVGGWLDTANDAKNFNLQVSWENWTAGDIVPTTTNDVPVETATGTAAQYKSFKVAFTIDYDVDSPALIESGDALGFRLRRLAASIDEIAGEFVVEGIALVYKIGSFGGASL